MADIATVAEEIDQALDGEGRQKPAKKRRLTLSSGIAR